MNFFNCRMTAAAALSGLSCGLQATVTDPGADNQKHIVPILADQAQEAISSMYSLISRYSEGLLAADGREAVLNAARALQTAIKVRCFEIHMLRGCHQAAAHSHQAFNEGSAD